MRDRKVFLTGTLILATLLLGGCSNKFKERSYEKEALRLAESYVESKYNEKLNSTRVTVESYFPAGLTGQVYITDEKGYKIIANVQNGMVSDNRQSELIENDLINEYIWEEGLIEEFDIGCVRLGSNPTNYHEQYYEGDLIAFFKEQGLNLSFHLDLKASQVLNSEDEIDDYLKRVANKLKSLEDSFMITGLGLNVNLVKPDKYQKFIYMQEGNFPDLGPSEYVYGSIKVYLNDNGKLEVNRITF